MALLIQHSHGKAQKLEGAFTRECAEGVIFAARNERPDKLAACVESLREDHDGKELLFDPQFYVSTLVPPNDRYLPEYNFYKPGLTAAAFASGKASATYAKNALTFQHDLGFDSLISPTVAFDGFNDAYYQAALSLAYASLEEHAALTNPNPLLLSFVFSEDALASRQQIDRFLDTVTQQDWGMAGFYLIVSRPEDGYQQRFEADRFAHLLYMTHALGVTNDLRVIFGYTDFCGLPLRAVGADAFANGWSQSVRRFQRKGFIKRKGGGQPPRDRYSSGPLFNSIFVDELQQIFEVDRLNDVLSRVDMDDLITKASSPQAADWGVNQGQMQHWQTLCKLDGELADNPKTAVRNLIRELRNADGLYRILEAQSVQFDRQTGKEHLMQWVEALTAFQRIAGWAS